MSRLLRQQEACVSVYWELSASFSQSAQSRGDGRVFCMPPPKPLEPSFAIRRGSNKK